MIRLRPTRIAPLCVAGVLAVALAGQARSDEAIAKQNGASGFSYAAAFQRSKRLREAGRMIFSDVRFSASGKQSCASCHDPKQRYNPPNADDVQRGGEDLSERGFRAPPTLTYLNRIPPYSNHYRDSDEEGDESVDNGPAGGLGWDGRVQRGEDQAKIPLLSGFEMANTMAGVARAARRGKIARTLRAALGEHALDDDQAAFRAVAHALGAFEQGYDEFNPYTSKYDAFLTGRAKLSPRESRGLALFEDEKKGNCASCHISKRGLDGTPPALSDYGMIALAVPRNAKIPRNADPAFFDLGVCGPERKDKAGQARYCGLFRTPTLRNVALRRTFFHNGVFHDLRKVVEFYASRDAQPERWYGRSADGKIAIYDDVPEAYRANINRDPPFAQQRAGGEPVLAADEIDAIVAFLGTLTDGYLKENPYRTERMRMNAAVKPPRN